MSNKSVIIDGSSFIYRAYYGYPKLQKSDGVEIGGVFGFCSMILSLLKRFQNQQILIVFDSGRDTFRTEKYPLYKANRSETPDDLIPQFAIIKEAVQAFCLPCFAQKGFEADDLIATFSQKLSVQNTEVTIVSSDKDLFQLINDKIFILDPKKNKLMNRIETHEKFGVYPEQIIDYLTMVGDASDNIPGVPGVGPKTAAKLLAEFNYIDEIYKNIQINPSILPKKILEKFKENQEQVMLSRWLITLKNDIEIAPNSLDFNEYEIPQNSLYDFFRKYGFNSLIEKL